MALSVIDVLGFGEDASISPSMLTARSEFFLNASRYFWRGASAFVSVSGARAWGAQVTRHVGHRIPRVIAVFCPRVMRPSPSCQTTRPWLPPAPPARSQQKGRRGVADRRDTALQAIFFERSREAWFRPDRAAAGGDPCRTRVRHGAAPDRAGCSAKPPTSWSRQFFRYLDKYPLDPVEPGSHLQLGPAAAGQVRAIGAAI